MPSSPAGAFVVMDGEVHYRISSYHRMAPFLMSLASDTDLWMFIASGGGLTAGRVDADGSLFPYRTVDQLHNAHHHTGPVTLINIEQGNDTSLLWEPFSDTTAENPGTERNLFKNTTGSRLVFEEINHNLGLVFRYCWSGSDEFGWVRSATLENRSNSPVRANLLDGLRNVLPHGAPLSLYQQSSNLVDAYKKSEVDQETGLGIFSLTTGIIDRAEALEVLRANTVWCCGLEGFRVHLSLEAVDAFRNGRVLSEESVRNGARGNYLVSAGLDLEPGTSSQWHLVGDTGRDHIQISHLRGRILTEISLDDRITESLRLAGDNLRRNVAGADGIQLSGSPESWSHHFSNVLFNNMRGGVFTRNHDVPVADFADFLDLRNGYVADRHRHLLAGLPTVMTIQELRQTAGKTGDPDFERLSHEYLPLHFGRRHGDPSRPWNRFSIRVRDRKGERALNYEGNWRDIFQNWEALGRSFPGFLPSIIAKFVNASTVDGFNPYRITREGVDWETVSAEDPWSNIGYWGDHQIIYLLKLLEALHSHDPAVLGTMLGTEMFSYADVPYIIKSYAEILRNPRATIEFDHTRAARIEERVAGRGTDGKLLADGNGSIHHANLFEKLLVPALSKLSNLIPDAGIWMNTQRPEWNDANNALGGGGVSVVTLCYLRRYLAFLANLLEEAADPELPVSTEVADWFGQIESILENEKGLLAARRLAARDRKRLMDLLGGAFSAYRETVYAHGFSGKTSVEVRRVARLCRTALEFIDQGIAANRRQDGLFHTYNLLDIADDENRVEVVHLQEMLEGQVAILSSGMLEPDEALEVLEQLYASAMYRPDQRSFMLYPERELPGFLAKNRIPESQVEAIPLLQDLMAAKDVSLVARDADGVCRFHGDFRSGDDLAAVLEDLGSRKEWSEAVARDRTAVLDLFEDVFRHRAYTGRSGAMYGYEGLGCIYWHMVAKLLLAVQENVLRAEREGVAPAVQEGLARMYFRVRSGIGYQKTVAEYGAFPTDPYSHTPSGGGAKQPGMTGQVKEEILTRFGELGIRIQDGAVRFQPVLLGSGEFLKGPEEFNYFDVEGVARSITLSRGNLAFTLCQVPVVYEKTTGKGWIQVTLADGSTSEHTGNLLDARLSAELFARSGGIHLIKVGLPEAGLNNH
ncbi:MAG: hypothetical protein ABFS42_13800 [Candidatus Krumholzibacteriota bacterium]